MSAVTGSSPLTRGPVVGQMRSWAAAHPRSRGENTCGLARADMVEGSSPLTRGKHADV